MGSRYYDPTRGQFISADPLDHFGSWDLYSYANHDPVNFCDPDGRLGKGFFTGDRSNTASNIGATFAQSVPEGPAIQNFVNNWRAFGNINDADPFVSPAEKAIAKQIYEHPVARAIREELSAPGVGGGKAAIKVASLLAHLKPAAKAADAATKAVPKVTEKGIVRIEQHLSRPGLEDALGRPALQDPANAHMIERLRSGFRTDQDIAFYMHELKESALMNRGIGARPAHLQTLEWQKIPYVRGYEKYLYTPDAIKLFNSSL